MEKYLKSNEVNGMLKSHAVVEEKRIVWVSSAGSRVSLKDFLKGPCMVKKDLLSDTKQWIRMKG